MPDAQPDEAFQKKYLEFYIVDQQLKQLHQHLMLMEKQAAELASILESLEQLATVKPGAPMYAPLGAGVFVKAELKDTKEILMHVGANTSLAKPVPESKRLIQQQLDELHASIAQLEPNVHKLMQRSKELQHELKAMQSQAEQ